MSNLEPKNEESLLDHLPIIMGTLTVEACLSQFPLQLLAFNLVKNIGSTYLGMRNQKEVQVLLESLKVRLDELEKDHKLRKEDLAKNAAYQEVAHRRLSLLSAMDTKEDLALSAALIALCGTLHGEDKRDKHLLRALGEITCEEVRLFQLISQMQNLFEEKKADFSIEQRRDAAVELDLKADIADEFCKRGERLLGLHSFEYLVSRIHALGLVEALSKGGFGSYRPAPKVALPDLTPIGDYFLNQLAELNLSFT